MLTRFLLPTLLFLLALPAAAAEEPVKDPSYSIVRYYESHVLDANGADTGTYERAIKVLKETAVEDLKQTGINYSTSIEKSEIISAYNLKADGRKLEVPPGNYQLEVNSGKDHGASPVYSDNTSLGIVFPDVAVNDTLVLKYKITQSEPMFAQNYSDYGEFDRDTLYEDAQISFDYPVSLPLRNAITGLTEKSNQEKDGRRTIVWTYQNKAPVKNKLSPAAIYEYGREPSYMVSTFPDYGAIAAAYGKRATPKAAVTPRIQKLADEITAGKTEPRAMAAALYDWVAKNITYAGNCIGVGAVVPRDLDQTLDNKMGDCKDHATLLQALLKAKGIASIQALINARAIYHLPKLPQIAAVNHVLNYIPSLDLYADATSEIMPFGTLPHALASKTVLLVEGDKPEATTPPWPRPSSKQIVKSSMHIREDGSAQGTVVIEIHGEAAIAGRAGLKKITPAQQEEALKELPKRYRMEGTITMSSTMPEDKPDTLILTYGFDFKKYLTLGNAGGLSIYPLFASPAMHYAVASSLAEKDATTDFSCSDGLFEEDYSFEFPKNVKILAVPDHLAEKNEVIRYESKYEQKNNTITVKRVFDDVTQGPICAPRIAALYGDIAQKIMPDLKAQILYK